MTKKEYSIEVAGKPLIAEFNDWTDQANGSVVVRYGNTVVLATAVMSKKAKDAVDFFPLTVDWEEKFYAIGKILGSRFQKREGRPTDEAILSGRIVDRTIRPLFGQHIRHEVQVVVTVLSIEQDDPDVLGVIAASLALGVSDIPWNGPVSAVRIGKVKDTANFIVNPTYELRGKPEFEADIVACGKDGNINMIEVGAQQIDEKTISDGLTLAAAEIEKIQTFQKNIIAERGKKKIIIEKEPMETLITALFEKEIAPLMHEYIFSIAGKKKIKELGERWEKVVSNTLPTADMELVVRHYDEKINELLHREAIENNKRPDGRTMDEIRPLFAQAGGISPILHGSGIFYRGGTHVLSALTLGGPGDTQIIDGMELQTEKRFMHHYNFPPFSNGETGRIGGTNRRMIGHGALAEKALIPVLPPKEKFPYTIRIVSESLASNGSTSMASVCGGTLALMDAGVPIESPVAGIASGLMMESTTKYKILTDIQGPEDEHGDMDFKVAGTRKGITAIQMDVKVLGVPLHILNEALEKARVARLAILDVIEKAIAAPREKISPNAPEIVIVKIKQDQIGLVIGPGGKTINEIRAKTLTEIDIEDDGTVFITGKNGGGALAAKIIEAMTKEYKKGERYEGTVTKVVDFGAFVRIGPNVEALLHVSEIAPFRVEKVETFLKTGDKIPVIIKEIDLQNRIKLSVKDIEPNFFRKPEVKM